MKNLGLYALTGIAFGGALAGLVHALSIPDVHFSYSTGDCVEVINYTEEQFTCENMPEKFNHVWVN